MKRSVFLSLLLLLAASSAFAGYRHADLKLSVAQNQAFTMTLSGLHYYRADRSFVLRDLEPGRHWLEVRSACGTRVLYRGHIFLQPSTQVKAKIDNRGRYVVREVLTKAHPASGPVGVCGTPNTGSHGGNQPFGVYNGHPAGAGGNSGVIYNGNGYTINNHPHVLPVMGNLAFDALLRSLDAQRFDDARVAIANQAFQNNRFTALQLRAIMLEMRFERNRLEVAKLGYNSLVDPRNIHVVTDAFRFSSSTTDLYAWIG
jgi:hypothetical protein